MARLLKKVYQLLIYSDGERTKSNVFFLIRTDLSGRESDENE